MDGATISPPCPDDQQQPTPTMTPPPPPPPKHTPTLSKTQMKKLAKLKLAEEEKAAAEAAAAEFAAAEAAEAELAEANACSSASGVLNKRLRTLRKRLSKIEKYQAADPLTLNLDQVQAVGKKETVVTLIKELEELLGLLEVMEKEEVVLKREMAKTQAKLVSDAVEAKETEMRQKMVDKFARYYSNLYILDALFIQESAGGGGAGAGSANGDLPKMFSPVALQFNEQQFNAILYLRSVLTGFGLDSNLCPLDTFSKKADETLDFLISCSDTEFINGVTYAELDKLLKTILSPPPLPVFGGGEAVDAPTAPVAASDAVAAATAAVLEDSSVMSTTDSVVAPTSTITNTVAAATTTVFTTTNEAVHHSSEHFGGGNFAPQEVRFGSFGSINFINPVVEEIVHQDAAGFIIEQPKVDAPMMLMDEQLHHQQQYQQQQPRFPVVSTTAPAAEQEEGVATSSSVGGEVKEGEGSMEVKQHPKKSTRQRGSRGRGGKKKDVSLLESLAGNDTPHPLHQQQQQQPLKQQQQQKNYLPPPPPLQHQKQQKTAAVQKQKPVPMQQQKTGGGGGRRRPFNKAPAAATSVTGSAAVQA